MEAIILSFVAFLSTALGGLVGLKNRNKLHFIMSFTAGVLLAVCFFDIIPEMFKITSEAGLDITYGLVALVGGFLLIHTLEKATLIHHSHEHEYAEHKHPTVGLLGAGGLAFHSFLDGLGIGLGFHINSHVGLLVAIAVIAHDFSDGLNTVTIMLSNKNTLKKTKLFLLIDAVTPILGVLSTYLFSIPNNILQLYLGFFAGFLLYIGASDLLPEAHSQHSSYKMIGLTILGVVFIFVVTRFA
ncbi:MAG TPA: ZIP family metal transporter [Candidatus Saccharimonadales bacterium]|nr:ZIP family metal transporter [Candidatus Saccharimonadales bacterium]